MKAKATMWVAKRPGGHLATTYSGRTRPAAYEALMTKGFGNRANWPWKKLYRGGWRIVRVSVREL